MTKRRGLGRGLSSLIPGGDIEESLETGLITLCAGGGMGIATIVERV